MSEQDVPGAPPIECWQCHSTVPHGTFCVVCGHALAEEAAARREAGGRFRANPEEPARAISLTSTLFPQLPRAELDVFRIALLLGTALVVGLTLLEAYPLAVAVGAAVVPLLVLVYVYEVDVYEDEPIRIIGTTFVWGVVSGVLVALLVRSLETGAAPGRGGGEAAPLVIPAIASQMIQLAAILVGPLMLLRYRRFNDVLDGATFGVASAAGFAGAYTVIVSAGLLSGGLFPGGDVASWLFSIVNLALVRPILLVSVAGAICAAFWLRYRGPAGDRGALGMLGSPWLALVVGAVALSIAALVTAMFPTVVSTIVRVAIAGAALLWLRLVIHLGLRQEAAEVAIGPAATCPNCGRHTAWHSFCANCGIALRALPKRGRLPIEPAPGSPRR